MALGRKLPTVLLLACILLVLVAIPGTQSRLAMSSTSSSEYWPTSGWRYSAPEEQGMNSTYMDKMEDYIHNQSLPIDSVVIIRHGYVIEEEYTRGPYQQNQSHYLASVTKSFCSALIGIAIEEGYIDGVDHKVLDFFPNRTIMNMSSWKQGMTLEHLLTMTSGIHWSDNEESGLVMNSADAVKFILDQPVTFEPGTMWSYCSGGSHLLSAIVNVTTGMDTLTFARERLFDPLGISQLYWKTDSQGIPWGFAYLYMRALDMAKFGYLYLHHGMWDGRQIIPVQWVADSTGSAVYLGGFEGYGYQWWTNNRTGLFDAPTFEARGAMGQRIIVVPEYDMVVAFTGSFETENELEVEDFLLHNFILNARIPLQGDVYFDWTVDIVDLVIVAAQYGGPPQVWNRKADINKDGIVDILDIVIVAGNFGKTN